LLNTCLLRYVDELRDSSRGPDIAEKMIWLSHDRYEQVLPAVLVIIVRCSTLYHPAYSDSGLGTDVRERPIAVVDIKTQVRRILRPRHLFAHDLVPHKKIEQPVIVEIRPNCGLRGIIVKKPRLGCDVCEGTVAIVPQQ